MILALNTAQKLHEMALIELGESPKIFSEKTWNDEKNDVEELVPMLKEMLEELGLDKKQISDIAVVIGPGPFTAIRTGVAFANALAEGLKVKLHTIDTFSLLRMKTASKDTVLVVLNAGGMDVGVNSGHQVKIGPIAPLLAEFPHDHSHVIVSECNETQDDELRSICTERGWKHIMGHELQTMAEAILTFGLDEFGLEESTVPYYLKDPKITKSQNPWKQP